MRYIPVAIPVAITFMSVSESCGGHGDDGEACLVPVPFCL